MCVNFLYNGGGGIHKSYTREIPIFFVHFLCKGVGGGGATIPLLGKYQKEQLLN